VGVAFECHGITFAVVTRCHKSAFLRRPLVKVYAFNLRIVQNTLPIGVQSIANYACQYSHHPNQ
jgi:hypothetical protein